MDFVVISVRYVARAATAATAILTSTLEGDPMGSQGISNDVGFVGVLRNRRQVHASEKRAL